MKTKIMSLALTAALFSGCAEKKETSPDEALSITSANLKAVEAEYVPESISDTTGAGVSAQANHDLCAGLDFVQCQPRLIRAYLLYGRGAVSFTLSVVVDVARHLSGAPDNSSGTFTDTDKNLTIEYNKRSLLDYDFLIIQGGVPVGRVSANPELYNIQFDLDVLDANKPESRGGKIDVQVKFTDRTHWQSQITITDAKCKEVKPDDPENTRLMVTRNGEIWTAQAMFYNRIGAIFGGTKTCSTPSNDDTGIVLYTDVVADRIAAKAALYIMKRNETSTVQLETFGYPGFCTHYPDLCQSLATAIGSNPSAVNTYLNTLANPYCVRRGSPSVTFNSDCSSLSPAVAGTPFLPNNNWMTASDFYQLRVTIPNHL